MRVRDNSSESSADGHSEDEHNKCAHSVHAGKERNLPPEPQRLVPMAALLQLRNESGPQREVVEDAQIKNDHHQDQFHAKGRGDLEGTQ